jgi:hypothetical protein
MSSKKNKKQTKTQQGNERLTRYIKESLDKIKTTAREGVKLGSGAVVVVFEEETERMFFAYLADKDASEAAKFIGMAKEYEFMRLVFDPVGLITVIGLLHTPGGTEYYGITQVKL